MQIDDVTKPRCRARTNREPASEQQILADCEMRKQSIFLKDIAHPATMGGDPNAALGVEQYRPVDDDPSPFRAHQPGDHIDDRGLARSRAAEQCGETASAAKMDIELEGAEPVFDIDLEYRAHPGSCRAVPTVPRYRQSGTVPVSSTVKPGATIKKRIAWWLAPG